MARHETLVNYEKALRMLQRRMRTPSTDSTRAALICSIIFYCFEATLGNSRAATAHLQGGLNLLSSLHEKETTPLPDLDSVTLEFERLDLQALLFYDQSVPFLEPPKFLHPVSKPSTPHFHRISDAYRAMVTLMYRGWTVIFDNMDHKNKSLSEIPLPALLEKQAIRNAFQDWKTRFEDLHTRLSDAEAKGYGAQILLVHWHLSTLLLDGILPYDADSWSASPNLRAAELLSLIENILQLEPSSSPSSPRSSPSHPSQRTVSSEMGVVAPLFALTLKCADQAICDRAFELLRSTKRREGLWDAEHMASLIEKLREMRETGFGEGARNVSLEVLFEKELDVPVKMGRDLKASNFEEVVVGLYRYFRGRGV